MVLSTGTLNLKFMQRAAARNAQTQPSEAGPSTPKASSSTPTSTPSAVNSSTSKGTTTAPVVSAIEVAAEGERWFLPRPASTPSSASRPANHGWTFEPSYMPFLNRSSSTSASTTVSGSGSTSTPAKTAGEEGGAGTVRAGGGRMTFGFGEEKKEEEEEKEGDDEEEDEDDFDSDEGMQVKGAKPREKKHAEKTATPGKDKTFRRPAGFDSPKPSPRPARSDLNQSSTKSAPLVPARSQGQPTSALSTATPATQPKTSGKRAQNHRTEQKEESDTVAIPSPSDTKGKKRKNPPTPVDPPKVAKAAKADNAALASAAKEEVVKGGLDEKEAKKRAKRKAEKKEKKKKRLDEEKAAK